MATTHPDNHAQGGSKLKGEVVSTMREDMLATFDKARPALRYHVHLLASCMHGNHTQGKPYHRWHACCFDDDSQLFMQMVACCPEVKLTVWGPTVTLRCCNASVAALGVGIPDAIAPFYIVNRRSHEVPFCIGDYVDDIKSTAVRATVVSPACLCAASNQYQWLGGRGPALQVRWLQLRIVKKGTGPGAHEDEAFVKFVTRFKFKNQASRSFLAAGAIAQGCSTIDFNVYSSSQGDIITDV